MFSGTEKFTLALDPEKSISFVEALERVISIGNAGVETSPLPFFTENKRENTPEPTWYPPDSIQSIT